MPVPLACAEIVPVVFAPQVFCSSCVRPAAVGGWKLRSYNPYMAPTKGALSPQVRPARPGLLDRYGPLLLPLIQSLNRRKGPVSLHCRCSGEKLAAGNSKGQSGKLFSRSCRPTWTSAQSGAMQGSAKQRCAAHTATSIGYASIGDC